MIRKAIKKSIEIEFMQFTEENKNQVYSWTLEVQGNIIPDVDEDNKPCLKIPTLEGDMICSLGDYLIKEPFPTDWRKMYPCKPDIFEKTYNVISETTKPNLLDTNLKIFRIEDEEEHFIVANTKDDAIKYFINEMNFDNYQICDLQVSEVNKDDDIQINLFNDSEDLLKIINKYRNVKDKVETINIWDLLKYHIIECELQDKQIELPYVIASSTFN